MNTTEPGAANGLLYIIAKVLHHSFYYKYMQLSHPHQYWNPLQYLINLSVYVQWRIYIYFNFCV